MRCNSTIVTLIRHHLRISLLALLFMLSSMFWVVLLCVIFADLIFRLMLYHCYCAGTPPDRGGCRIQQTTSIWPTLSARACRRVGCLGSPHRSKAPETTSMLETMGERQASKQPASWSSHYRGGCKNTWGYKQVRSVGAPLECSTSLYYTTNINEVRMLLILTNYHRVNPTQDTDTSHVSYHVCLSVSLSAVVCLWSLSFSRSVSLYVSMSVSMSIVLLPGGT